MKNELLTIGPFTIYGYGFMIAMAILMAYGTIMYRAGRRKMDTEKIFWLVILCVAGGFAGAKLLFLCTEWKWVLEDPVYYLWNLSDGFVVFGGILGGILTGYLYCRKQRLPFLACFDLVMPSIALAQGIGRIGCFLAGCCYGRETSSRLSIVFHESDFAPNGVHLVPTQLYSCALDLLHFAVLLFIAKRKKADGQVAACYLIFYSIGRFCLEFLRGDENRGSIGMLSTSQFLSIFTLAGGILLLFICGRRKAEARPRP